MKRHRYGYYNIVDGSISKTNVTCLQEGMEYGHVHQCIQDKSAVRKSNGKGLAHYKDGVTHDGSN